MALHEAVALAFGPSGVLARCVQEFTPRSGQALMAQAVANTVENGGVLLVEAGTGVGKTFAYLVPTLLSGQRVLLSTATKTLQDQLFGRDIPKLLVALGLPLRIALLKGRSSYLCAHRLSGARQGVCSPEPAALRDLARIEAWAVTTRSGDIAELTLLDERSPVIPWVTSTRENCLGAKCPQVQNCHVNQARRGAMGADVVVINHHLFFADLNIRESGVAELLPTVDSIVFDEAHQMNEIGIQFLGRQLTTGQLDGYCRELTLYGHQLVLAFEDWRAMVVELGRSVATLRNLCNGADHPAGNAWCADAPPGVDTPEWEHAVTHLHRALQQSEVILRSMEEHSPELKGLRERASGLMADLDVFSHGVPPGMVRWMETGRQVKFVQSPLDIAQTMRLEIGASDAPAQSQRSWIFTSATLGHDATLGRFVETCGLETAHVLQIPSPFDYETQAALYIPAHMPKPSDPNHSASVAALVAQGAAVLGGRTLVLTTTLRAMRDIAVALRLHFTGGSGMDVLLQGESPKLELTERFSRQGSVAGANGCILVASNSFWEGVDIPGDALQMVVIDKLPFSPPDDPLVEARALQMRAKGNNPFLHLHIPEAATALKQGAGRLIRRETDRGILVVCDVRLTQKGYGRKILAALPVMPVIATPQEFARSLLALTRPSTTDHSPSAHRALETQTADSSCPAPV